MEGVAAPAPGAVNLATEIAKAAGTTAPHLVRPNESTGAADEARLGPVAAAAHAVVAPNRDTHHIGPHIKPSCAEIAQCRHLSRQSMTYEQEFHSTTASGTRKEFV